MPVPDDCASLMVVSMMCPLSHEPLSTAGGRVDGGVHGLGDADDGEQGRDGDRIDLRPALRDEALADLHADGREEADDRCGRDVRVGDVHVIAP